MVTAIIMKVTAALLSKYRAAVGNEPVHSSVISVLTISALMILPIISCHDFCAIMAFFVQLLKKTKPRKCVIYRVLFIFDDLRCGERGIRTPGPLTVNGFQDRRNRPLCHLSGGKSTKPGRIAKSDINFFLIFS